MKVQVGNRYERLIVLELIKNGDNPKTKCICECGNISYPSRARLKSGKAISCGCLRKERQAQYIQKLMQDKQTYGESGSPLYQVWQAMRQRCENANDRAFHNYGERGITVSERWHSYPNFREDMGIPAKGMTLERLNTNGPYSKENCIWATHTTQRSNQRTTKIWIINGVEFLTKKAAGKFLKVDDSVITRRCRGYWRYGKWHDPVAGYSWRYLYENGIDHPTAQIRPTET